MDSPHSLLVFLVTVFFNHHSFIIYLVSLQFVLHCRGWMWCKQRQYVFTKAQKHTFKHCCQTLFFFSSLLATWIIWNALLPQTTSPQNRTCYEFDSPPRVSTTTPSPSRPSHWGDQSSGYPSVRQTNPTPTPFTAPGKKYYWLTLRLCLLTCLFVCVCVCVCVWSHFRLHLHKVPTRK